VEKYFLIVLVLVISFVSLSCSNSSMYIDVIEGNYAFSRGEYQEANLDYLNVRGKKMYNDYISYNLGNVYYALGEVNSAFKEWESVNEDMESKISIQTYFNTGVLLFELSRYEDAYQMFRNILEFDPSNINAKINLEYSIQKMNFSRENSIKQPEEVFENNHETYDVSRVLDFVKRKESNIWKSTENPHTNSSNQEDW